MGEIINFDNTTTPLTQPRCACIGYFDGLHRGHQQLIEQTIDTAKKHHLIPTMITFDPDPWVTMGKTEPVYHITPLAQRCRLALSMGIEDVLILNFTKDVMSLSIDAFESLLLSNGITTLVVGYDFTYGKFGKGNASTLQANGRFTLVVVPPFVMDDTKVSSSRIERCLLDGDIPNANRLLGYPFFIEGHVVHGRHVGHSLSFPTANIKPSDDQLIPAKGVYATWLVIDGKRYASMCNIGHNPTCNYVSGLSVEVNIFDFDQDIYGHTIRIEFIQHIRDEHKFDSIDGLKAQLNHDRETIKRVLSNG